MQILITRPEEDAQKLASSIEQLGHKARLGPLIKIEYTTKTPDVRGLDGLIATSRHGLLALDACNALADVQHLPLYVVGPATRRTAERLGFDRVTEGPGTAEALATVISSAETFGAELLHLAGNHVAYELAPKLSPHGITIRHETMYRSVAIMHLSDEICGSIRRKEIHAVILMSPRTARIYIDVVNQAAINADAKGMTYYCLSSAVAEVVSELAPNNVRIAEQPTVEALLKLIKTSAADAPKI